MVPNLRDPEQRLKETIRISKGLLRKRLKEALEEVEYLINATPTGDERNLITDVQIHIRSAQQISDGL